MAHQRKHKPSLLLVLCSIWLCLLVASARAQSGGAAEQEARVQAEHGVRAFAEGDYHAAIAAFVRADQLRPNPAFAYDIGRAYEELHATERALFFYREYLRRAPGASDRREAQARIDALSQDRPAPTSHAVRLRTQPAGASVWIDSEPVGRSPLVLELPSGVHRATFRMPGRRPQSVRIELLRNQGPLEVEARLVPETADASASGAPQPAPAASTQATTDRRDQGRHTLRSLGFGAMLASVGALGGAVAFEVMRADSERSATQARESLRPTQAADRAQAQKTLSRVFAGAGGGLAAIGITLLVLSREPGEEQRPTSRLALQCAGPTKCRAELSGVF